MFVHVKAYGYVVVLSVRMYDVGFSICIYISVENIFWCFSVSLINKDNVTQECVCLSADW